MAAAIAGFLLGVPPRHVNPRQRWERLVVVECLQPLGQRLRQLRQLNPVEGGRMPVEILHRSHQHRPHADMVSSGAMMQGYRHLDKSLPDFLLFLRCNPPDVFQQLMSIEELQAAVRSQ
jgi:hypothetical protein